MSLAAAAAALCAAGNGSVLSGWDVSLVEDFSGWFAGAAGECPPAGVSCWDVGAGTDFSGMFADARAFNGDLSHWEMAGARNTSRMFFGAAAFDADLSGWDVSGVADMSDMFVGAAAFRGNLAPWDVCGTEWTYQNAMQGSQARLPPSCVQAPLFALLGAFAAFSCVWAFAALLGRAAGALCRRKRVEL